MKDSVIIALPSDHPLHDLDEETFNLIPERDQQYLRYLVDAYSQEDEPRFKTNYSINQAKRHLDGRPFAYAVSAGLASYVKGEFQPDTKALGALKEKNTTYAIGQNWSS